MAYSSIGEMNSGVARNLAYAYIACNASNVDRDGEMATLTIRNVDDDVKRRLRQRAATRGVSMEEEARRALRNWVSPAPVKGDGLGTRLRRRFEALGGAEIDIPPRGPARPLPDVFDE